MARRTTWEDHVLADDVALGAQVAVDMTPALTADEGKGMTVTRVIAVLDMISTTVAGAWGVQRVTFGMGVIDRDAFGVGAFPDPNTQDDEPAGGWLYRSSCAVAQNGTGAQVIYSCRFDTRAQRKMGNGQLALIWNNDAILGTAFTVRVLGLTRSLMLLP